ncbi:MAG: hypothetical protein AVDCRST_MAG68-195 [uncultured Gemmatimonadetes bacterium]|uniref:Uncharacterized protein n=1 Tax=uncultured Gemmatimonadota bacterium TaxID=203437 RepID=A0A6J4K830_9BACT|nr:MAG: hypothetical protein AVDCRST_MAG68-195 [uncultured Gemmatimonadota bacterium]
MRVTKRAKGGIAALGLLLLTAAAPGGEAEQTPVRVSIAEREGAGTTVCLQAAPAVRGRKRAQVSHGGGHAVLSVSPESPGPHCAELANPAGTVLVSLHFSRAWVIPSTLGQHSYPADEVRGKRLTFLWLRD